MARLNISFNQLLSNLKLLALTVFLVLAAAVVVSAQSEQTTAFLSTGIKNIRMGVNTDKWEPPQPPVILGFTTAEDLPLSVCGSITNQAEVVLEWQAEPTKPLKLASFLVNDQVVDGKEFALSLPLTEGENVFTVISTDSKDQQSLASEECMITLDTTAPVVSITSPTAEVVGKIVTITATVEEANLVSSQIEIVNSQGEQEAVGGTFDTETKTLSFDWDATGLESGDYTIFARAEDQVGQSTASEKQITLDLDAPTSTLSMEVPVSPEAMTANNGSFEQGLYSWTSQGDVQVSGLSQVAAAPKHGSLAAVLGRANQSNQVSLLSKTITPEDGEEAIKTIGFWYYLNPTLGESTTEGMMVFAGEELVHQEWLSASSAGWRYLLVDVSELSEASISIAYSHDGDLTTGGELYLDGFAVNQNFALDQIAFTLSALEATVFAEYAVNGQLTSFTGANQLSFTVSEMPDNGQVFYWAEDGVGNRETTRVASVPVVTSVAASPEDPEATPTPSPSPSASPEPSDEPEATQSGELSASLIDAGEYHFELSIDNARGGDQIEYTIIYQHGAENLGDESALQEAVQGQITLPVGATSTKVEGLYFGTCSSTAGEVCTPHLFTANISVELAITRQDGQTRQYQISYPGFWILESDQDAE